MVAVARKLAVLLHHLWVSGEEYEPLHNTLSETIREESPCRVPAEVTEEDIAA